MPKESSVVWKKSGKDFSHRQSLKKSFPVEGGTFDNAGSVSSQIKSLLKEMKLPDEVVKRASVVAYEAETNICAYARHGRIVLRVTNKHVVIEATDEGQGIADLELAMVEGFSTASKAVCRMGFGAGLGLSNIKNCSDSFHIASKVGKGTSLKTIIFIKKDAGKA